VIRRLKSKTEELPGTYPRKLLINASDAPSGEESEALRLRRAELLAALAPERPQDIERELLTLRIGFGSSARDELSAGIEAKSAAKALAGFPTWAVAETFRRANTGEAVTIPVTAHCPSPPQLASECRAILEPIHIELADISALVDADVQRDPAIGIAERLRAVAQWQSVRAEIDWRADNECGRDPQRRRAPFSGAL
jgi:hypothetical protein